MYTKCPHCQGSMFELVENTPQGSAFKLNFVQCLSCGAPVGVTEYFSTSHEVLSLKKQIETLQNSVHSIENKINTFSQSLR